MRRLAIAILLPPFLLCVACSDDEAPVDAAVDAVMDAESDPLRAGVVDALARDVALGHYIAFRDAASFLTYATADLCAAPTPEALSAARDAWWAAREPWKRAEVVEFGPVVEYPERLGPKLDSWPVSADAVEELVAGSGPLDQDAFDAMGAATRGLPVVEYLLYAGGEETLKLLNDSPRRCAVLEGAARDVHANAARMVDAWSETWVMIVGAPSPGDDMYDTPQDVIDEWVNRMAFTLENMRSMKLGRPLGDRSGGEPRPQYVESRFSGRSLTDCRDALRGVRDVWDGDGDATEARGISDLLDDSGELTEQVDGLFDAAEARLGEVPETLEDAVVGDPAPAVAAQDALRDLQIGIQIDLAQALGVTITFNDNDGD